MGYGTATVGLVMGLAPVATLLTRQVAGALGDRRGAKTMVVVGLVTTALSGVAYLPSGLLPTSASLAAIVLGRAVLGLGDSLFTTALTAWVVARVGPQHAGRALAWNGIAMYGAPGGGGAARGRAGPRSAASRPSRWRWWRCRCSAIPVALSIVGMPVQAARRKLDARRVRRDVANGARHGAGLRSASARSRRSWPCATPISAGPVPGWR